MLLIYDAVVVVSWYVRHSHYPEFMKAQVNNPDGELVRFLDVGCGFGGLLIR